MKRIILITFTVSYVIISCGTTDRETKTNKILEILVKNSIDSTATYFIKVDSLGEKKFVQKTISKKPDSVAVYYRTVDSLRFKMPLTRMYFKTIKIPTNSNIDSLISKANIKYWNKNIASYKSREWQEKEKYNLPVVDKKPKTPKTIKNSFSAGSKLQKMLLLSTPFYNKKRTKALVYQLKISSSGKSGTLFILLMNNDKWNIVYRGNTFIATF